MATMLKILKLKNILGTGSKYGEVASCIPAVYACIGAGMNKYFVLRINKIKCLARNVGVKKNSAGTEIFLREGLKGLSNLRQKQTDKQTVFYLLI